MTTNQDADGLPIFVAHDGKPINFRIVGNPRMKARYRLLLMKFRGEVCKNSGTPRLNIVHGDMPCEEGHQGCSEHPPFQDEPLFRASWVDDCISQKELLSVAVYLMNPTPVFARIDFAQRLASGYYAPAVLSSLSKPKVLNSAPSYRLLTIDLSAPITPDVLAELRAVASSVNQNESDPVRPGPSSSSAVPRERQKESNARSCGPLSSSTPVGAPAGSHLRQSPIGQKDSCSASNRVRRHLSPEERNLPSRTDVRPGPSKETTPAQKNQPSRTNPSPGPSKRLQTPEDTGNPAKKGQQNLNRPVFCGITYGSSDSGSSTSSPPNNETVTAKKTVTAERAASSGSDDEFGPPPGAVVRLKGISQNTRAPYTHSEEVAILKYILASKRLEGLRSNVVWKEMDGKPGVERRTWQSLREHFLKKMIPKLERFNLTRDQMQRMRKTNSK